MNMTAMETPSATIVRTATDTSSARERKKAMREIYTRSRGT
jgi:hypothetical protein